MSTQQQLVGVVVRSTSVRSIDVMIIHAVMNIYGIMNIHDVGQLNRSWRILAANVHSGCKLLLQPCSECSRLMMA